MKIGLNIPFLSLNDPFPPFVDIFPPSVAVFPQSVGIFLRSVAVFLRSVAVFPQSVGIFLHSVGILMRFFCCFRVECAYCRRVLCFIIKILDRFGEFFVYLIGELYKIDARAMRSGYKGSIILRFC
jgi:hypothetical protein